MIDLLINHTFSFYGHGVSIFNKHQEHCLFKNLPMGTHHLAVGEDEDGMILVLDGGKALRANKIVVDMFEHGVDGFIALHQDGSTETDLFSSPLYRLYREEKKIENNFLKELRAI